MKFIFPDRPSIMGILNVTPDSFSDGGKFNEMDSALRHAEQMIKDGADIIDVGGESTRPGAAKVTTQEELDRVLPVVERLKVELDVCISVDTSTARVMRETAACGIDLINDVRALQREGALVAAKETGLPVCLMHMQGEPATMQNRPQYENVVDEVREFFQERIVTCAAAGMDLDKILLDPGFGFGKSIEHNLSLINQLDQYQDLGCPLLVGLSRKSTITRLLGDSSGAALTGSLVGAVWAFQKGAKILRVHDVAETRWALQMAGYLSNS